MNVKHDVGLRLLKVLNILMISASFAAVFVIYYSPKIGQLAVLEHAVITVIYLGLYALFGKIYDAFLISIVKKSEIVYSQTLAFLITDAVLYLVTGLLLRAIPNLIPMILLVAVQFVLSLLWTVCVNALYFRWFPPKKTAIVYDMRKGFESLIGDYNLQKKYKVELSMHVDDCVTDPSVLDGCKTVFLSGIHSRERNIILKYCVEKGISVFVIPRVGDVIMSSAKKMHMFHLPILRVDRYNPSPFYLLVKRIFDIFVSLVAMVVLSPIFAVTAIAIRATDKGPVFYKQERLTKDGKIFKIHKFRSMRVDAEKDGVARLSTGENDDRITPVGRIIRKLRIDELPQLIDILNGSLTIVGPRPERPQIAADYCREMPEFSLRLQAKAGLTGYAQVYGKYNSTPYDKLQMDLMYIANPSLMEDLKICFATVKILFLPESTEGVEVGQTTAMDYENSPESTEEEFETVAK